MTPPPKKSGYIKRDVWGLPRKQVSIRVRKKFHDAIEKNRGGSSWAVAMQQALEVGLAKLGWYKEPKE